MRPEETEGSILNTVSASDTAKPSAVDFDVIIVGAGVAGCVAAIELARAGKDVAVIERGVQPGAKNLSGGIFYSRIMEEILPNFLSEAPVERKITRNVLSFLNENSHVNIDYWDRRLASPVNAVSVLRGKLDLWLSEQAEEAGAMIMPGVMADRLLRGGNGNIFGIGAGDEQITAHLVLAADGVNSFLARDAGIRKKAPNKQLAVGIKTVIALPRNTIEQRFGLNRDENDGCAFAMVGDATQGVAGGGFLYTNTDSVSAGVVLRLDDLQRSGLSAAGIHDRFLAHPAVAPYLADGKVLEYGCHLTIEDGPALSRQPLTAPGLMLIGDAAGFTLNTGMTIRGMDLAAESARLAARTAVEALAAEDFSEEFLSSYPQKINASPMGKDLRLYSRTPAFLDSPRLYGKYGNMAADIFYELYNIDLRPRKKLSKIVMRALRRSGIGITEGIRDAYNALRAL